MMITGKTKVFGVIADPIAHVRSPMVFNPMFEARGVDAVLVPLNIKPESLGEVVRGLAAMPNFGGVCVTNPHKMALAALCDELSLAAIVTGAVNVVKFEQGRIIGANFDGDGFVAGLHGEGYNLGGKNIVLIGAGGAARAIAVALANSGADTGAGIASLTIANRTASKAEGIATMLNIHFPNFPARSIEKAELDSILPHADIIINATTQGLKATDSLPCTLENAKPTAVIADIIMVPAMTKWLHHATDLGLKTHAGRFMLDYQSDLIANFLDMF